MSCDTRYLVKSADSKVVHDPWRCSPRPLGLLGVKLGFRYPGLVRGLRPDSADATSHEQSV
jgi:hypothetical protein